MTDLIKFNVIPKEDKEVAVSVKRSNKIGLYSILITVLILASAIYIMFGKKEPGVVEEKAPKIVTEKKEPAKKTTSKQAQNTILASADDSLLSYSNDVRVKILSTREIISTTLTKITELKPSLKSLSISNSSELRIIGLTDKKATLDTLVMKLKDSKIGRGFKPTVPDKIEKNTQYTIKGVLNKRDSVPDALKLTPVKPFNRGPLVNYVDSIASANGMKVTKRQYVGTTPFKFGQRFDFVMNIEGTVSELMKTLVPITSTTDMLFLKDLRITFDPKVKDIVTNPIKAKLTVSLYNPTRLQKQTKTEPDKKSNKKDS